MPPNRLGRAAGKVSAVAIGVAALVPATAQATITIGSDLTRAAEPAKLGCILSTPPCTRLMFGVHRGNAFPAKSPTDGVVVAFGIKTGAPNDVVKFRVGRFGSKSTAASATGVGTGLSTVLGPPGIYSVPASVPLKAGDAVGIDTVSTSALAAYPGSCANDQAGYYTYYPTLTDGGPLQPADANSICEVLVNAVIQPSNAFSFGKLRQTEKGAVLTVKVPGPGRLSLAGKGVARRSAAPGRAVASRKVAAAGKTTLKITPTGKTKSRLAANGKAGVKIRVTFSPVGGEPRTRKRKLTLRG